MTPTNPTPASPPDAAAQPLLEVRGLTIDLHGHSAQTGLIENVSFSVRRGGSVALIGESGCGKTLTALSLLGLLPPVARVTGGTALFDGIDLLTRTPRQLRKIRGGAIGAVFQDPMSSLNPTLRIGDHIAEPRRLHLGESRRAAWRHAQELLDRVGIPNAAQRLHAYPHELSGGMQQRVVIAAAIACGCKLLIADEPTTALDVTIQAEILDLLHDLQRELAMAVLLVTHDLGVVAEFCDDVVVMYAGHVVERSGVRDTFHSRQHPYTDALFAAVPRPGHAHSELMTISGRVPAAGRMPAGCRFMPRCVHAEDECALPQPELEVSAGHTTRCGRVAAGSLRLEEVR